MTTKKSFAKEVWETLSAINVSEQAKKKGNLNYLPWTWAWGKLMEHYPESQYAFREPVLLSDGSCEVWVSLSITEGDNTLTREMWLPVMDNRNKAVANPSTRQISDTRMRCLTKCIAMFGLGHYIYAGEDLPEADKPEPVDIAQMVKDLEAAKDVKHLQDTFAKHWTTADEDTKKQIKEVYDVRKAEFEQEGE